MPKVARGIKIEPSHKRVRIYLAGQLVADTLHAVLVWEGPHFPVYYLPTADIRAELITTGRTEHSPSRGDAQLLDVKVATATAVDAALRYADSPLAELHGLVRLEWDSMSEWLEEDEPVYTHPRDPYKRVDILASSRHVRVEIDGVTVADSRQPSPSPIPASPAFSSRPACRRGTTCPSPTCGSTCSGRRMPRPTARTRGPPATGR